jgi:hypothetical protein
MILHGKIVSRQRNVRATPLQSILHLITFESATHFPGVGNNKGVIMRAIWGRLTSKDAPAFLWWLWIGLGIVLRLRQYAANRSFWQDEACLALNLVNRTFGGLTRPLDYEQGAPVAFLFIEKSIMAMLGNKDYILRLFPLISGILAIYLLYRIAREYFGMTGMLAVLMFSISSTLILYSSELKQYSSDGMVALLLIFLSLPRMGKSVRGGDFLLLGGVGIFAIWISHPSTFILAGIGLVMAFERFLRKDYLSLAWLLGVGCVWLVALGAEYFFSLRYLVADSYLQFYWRKAFLPLPPWENLGWFVKTYYSFLLMSLGRTDWILSLVFLALAGIGVVSLLARNWKVALVVILPFLMVSVASALNKYPLKDRFMLFLVPLGLLLMAEGVGRIHRFLVHWNRTPALIVSGVLVLSVFYLPASTTFQSFKWPLMLEHIKPVLDYVKDHKAPSDVVYVYHGAMPAFDYYAPFYGLDTGNVIIGAFETNNKVALQNFFDDVKNLDGRSRVWLIFSHIVDCGGCKGDPKAFYIQYLDGLGTMLDQFHAAGADAYLYNLAP